MNGLRAEGIGVTYPNGHVALTDASFDLPAHSITALLGVNGAGKSTLFKALMGFVKPTTGHVEFLGKPAEQALSQQMVAYVPQSEEVDWSFPVLVKDVVMMGRYGRMGFFRRAKPADKAAVQAALTRVGMQDYQNRQIGELSGGQKKRVFLARALAQEAQVILLDEPFAGVDVQTEEQIMELLKELRDEGAVILVATHHLNTVPQFCDHVVLVDGTVLDAGPLDTTFTPEKLRRAFGGGRSNAIFLDAAE